MTFLRRKTISEELLAHAQQLVAGYPPREAYDLARSRRGLGIAIGVSLGLGAMATAYLLVRRKALTQDEYDEHDPTRYRPSNASGDALDGTGEDNPIPGETGLY
jgi:hypothetical protein